MSGFVYVVDDDAAFRRAIERRLKIAGYEVASYPSAQHLLAIGASAYIKISFNMTKSSEGQATKKLRLISFKSHR